MPHPASFLARIGCSSATTLFYWRRGKPVGHGTTTELEEPYTDADEDRLKTFWDTRVEVDPCCDVIRGEPLEVTIWFKTDGDFSETDTLYVDLPSEFAASVKRPAPKMYWCRYQSCKCGIGLKVQADVTKTFAVNFRPLPRFRKCICIG